MTVSQVVDEVLYTGLLEMKELDASGEAPGAHRPGAKLHRNLMENLGHGGVLK
jgi:hypothetical protein